MRSRSSFHVRRNIKRDRELIDIFYHNSQYINLQFKWIAIWCFSSLTRNRNISARIVAWIESGSGNRTREKVLDDGWPLTLDDFRFAWSKMPISRQSFNWHQPGNRPPLLPTHPVPLTASNRPFLASCYTITRIRSHGTRSFRIIGICQFCYDSRYNSKFHSKTCAFRRITQSWHFSSSIYRGGKKIERTKFFERKRCTIINQLAHPTKRNITILACSR